MPAQRQHDPGRDKRGHPVDLVDEPEAAGVVDVGQEPRHDTAAANAEVEDCEVETEEHACRCSPS